MKKQLTKSAHAQQILSGQFQNRRGPGGIELDTAEAIAWFPPLTPAAHPESDGEIAAHCDVLVRYADLEFWLCDIEISVEPGFYFGNITEDLADNDRSLCKGDSVGFERRHVIRVRTH